MVTNQFAHIERVENIEAHLRAGVRDGITQTEEFLREMKEIAFDMIQVIPEVNICEIIWTFKATPWTRNNNVTGLIETVAKKIHLVGNPDTALNESVTALCDMNIVYSTCKKSYSQVSGNQAVLFCLLITREAFPKDVPHAEFFDLSNTFTIYPRIGFGFMFYYMMQNADSLAFKVVFHREFV